MSDSHDVIAEHIEEPGAAAQSAPPTEAAQADGDTGAPSRVGRRMLTIILIFLLLLLCTVGYFLFRLMIPAGTPTGDDTGAVGWVRSIYGFGEQTDQLTIPSGIAIDPANGAIWMADPGFFRVVEYQPDGGLASIIQPSGETTGPGQLQLRMPSDIAMDSQRLIYVAEPTYDVVRVFQTDGTEMGQIGIPEPLALAVNDDYLIVGASDGVAVLDKFGNVIRLIGTGGRGEGQFDKVNGVAIDEDDVVYAADSFNNRISAWTIQGENLWTTETGYPGNQQMTGETSFETSAAAQMQVPMGMTIDAAGRLVIADMHDFSLAVFDKETGEYIAKYGTLGLDDGKLYYPSDVDYDPLHDWYVVSDTGAKRAQIITLPGSGGSLIARTRNSLTGPLKACVLPVILLNLIILIAWLISRIRRKRRERELAEGRAAAVTAGEAGPA